MVDIFFDNLRVASTDKRAQMLYDPAWIKRAEAFPVSLSMPLGPDAVGHDRIIPWLANLLPETHLSEIGQQIGVSPQDVLGLLEHIGRDTAGALAIGSPRPQADDFRRIEREDDLEKSSTSYHRNHSSSASTKSPCRWRVYKTSFPSLWPTASWRYQSTEPLLRTSLSLTVRAFRATSTTKPFA